jgi:hypothetical protein
MEKYYTDKNAIVKLNEFSTVEEMDIAYEKLSKEAHAFPIITSEKFIVLTVANHNSTLEVENIQSFLDLYLKDNNNIQIDFVHGKDVVLELSQKANNLGILLPSLDKNVFFKSVIVDGSLPRKAFSMGEAEEKRFYMEARKIK